MEFWRFVKNRLIWSMDSFTYLQQKSTEKQAKGKKMQLIDDKPDFRWKSRSKNKRWYVMS